MSSGEHERVGPTKFQGSDRPWRPPTRRNSIARLGHRVMVRRFQRLITVNPNAKSLGYWRWRIHRFASL